MVCKKGYSKLLYQKLTIELKGHSMKRGWIHVLILSLLLICEISASDMINGDDRFSLVKKVNPFVGTDTVGHTYPGVSLPFGIGRFRSEFDNSQQFLSILSWQKFLRI